MLVSFQHIRYKVENKDHFPLASTRGVVVRTLAFHAAAPGSIPRLGDEKLFRVFHTKGDVGVKWSIGVK